MIVFLQVPLNVEIISIEVIFPNELCVVNDGPIARARGEVGEATIRVDRGIVL